MLKTRLFLSFFASVLVSESFAADPTLVVSCQSETQTLSIYQRGNRFEVSLHTRMTRESLKKVMPNMSEDGIQLMLNSEPSNDLPKRATKFNRIEFTDEVVKNGFRLVRADAELSLSTNIQGRVDIHYDSRRSRRGQTITVSATTPFGALSKVECSLIHAPR